MSTAIISPLSSQERDDFVRHTATIKRTKDAYIECGLALAAIRDGRLYRETHDTLAHWVEDEVGLTPQRIAQIIAAAKACQTMFDRAATTLPANSRQAAALAKVPEEHRVEVFEAAQEATGKEQPPAVAIDAQEAIRLAGGVAPEPPTGPLDRDSYSTPETYVAVARAALGGRIDLDPASNASAQNVVQASTWYSKRQDGLSRAWQAETVFLNPPYSQPACSEFVDKLVGSYQARDVAQAVALMNTASETRWWQSLARAASLVAFPPKRINFWHPEGETSEANRYAQTFFYLGREPERAHRAMRDAAADQKLGEWLFLGRLS